MFPSLVFSILAFFIVTTTTMVVIANKSKVKHVDNIVEKTRKEFREQRNNNKSQLHNLANEININNNKLEHKQNKFEHTVQKKNQQMQSHIDNIDKRFNSHKNITTANFIGINNRFSEEDNKIKKK